MRLIQQCLANGCALLFCASVLAAQGNSTPKDDKKEEIYIIRSVRTSHIAPTEFCARSRTGFDQASDGEDQYVFHAVETRADDGAVVNPLGKTIASLHSCGGRTRDPSVFNFYGEGEIAGIAFIGKGKCNPVKRDFPEPGMFVLRCFLDLTGLKSPYVGGVLTTNTMGSRNRIGEKSDPPGYTQLSIATVRLWKR
jgi:hypothetical protein